MTSRQVADQVAELETPSEQDEDVAPALAPSRFRRAVDALAGPVRRLTRLGGAQNFSLSVALVAVIALFAQLNENFLTWRNFEQIGVSVTIMGVLAVMETVAIILGGIDISVGSQVGVISVVAAMVFAGTGNGVSDGNALMAVAVALAVGAALGLVNGLIIIYGRVNPIIATLATLATYKGVAQVLSGGRARAYVHGDDLFASIGGRPTAPQGDILGLPTMIWILVVVALGVHVVLRYTDIGRNIYAIGGNATAARLAGINLNRYLISVYVLIGVVAAVAGIVLLSRTGSGHPTAGSEGLELKAITAAFLGGCAMRGGKGSVGGAILAVLLLGSLGRGLSVEGVNPFWQNVATGVLLVTAVVIQQRRSGERALGLPD